MWDQSVHEGDRESRGNPLARDFICTLEKGVEEPQEHTLCHQPRVERRAGWDPHPASILHYEAAG